MSECPRDNRKILGLVLVEKCREMQTLPETKAGRGRTVPGRGRCVPDIGNVSVLRNSFEGEVLLSSGLGYYNNNTDMYK
jgi:hypothetical protein